MSKKKTKLKDLTLRDLTLYLPDDDNEIEVAIDTDSGYRYTQYIPFKDVKEWIDSIEKEKRRIEIWEKIQKAL